MLFLKNSPLRENLPAHIPGWDLVTKKRKSRIIRSPTCWISKQLWLSAKKNYRMFSRKPLFNAMQVQSESKSSIIKRYGLWRSRLQGFGQICSMLFYRRCGVGRPLKNVRSSLIAFQVIGAIHLLHNFQSHEYFTSLRLLVNVAQPVVNYLEQDVTF